MTGPGLEKFRPAGVGGQGVSAAAGYLSGRRSPGQTLSRDPEATADGERPRPRRRIPGMVLAGDVESVGRSVTSFTEGDQVFGFNRWVVGGLAVGTR